MWFKEIKKRRKANELKRVERSDPLETSSLSLLMMIRI
jgi:hypothetical protein